MAMPFGRLQTAAVLIAALWVSSAAVAKPADCEDLRRRIAAFARTESRDAGRYARAVRRQQGQIQRTLDYSRSLGCDRGQLPLFDSPSPRCAMIETRLAQMNANLQALQQGTTRDPQGDGALRDDMIMRFNTYCGDDERGAEVPRSSDFADDRFAGRDPGDANPAPGFQRMPLEGGDGTSAGSGSDQSTENAAPPGEAPEADAAAGGALGGAKAVCVKTCDGSFFPISYSAKVEMLPHLEALCRANCPNAETKLFTYDIQSELDQAVDKDGSPYSDLPNARRYQKVFDGSCSCRAPGKTWLETLAEAERLYAGDRRDVVVTQSMSDASARSAIGKAAAAGSTLVSRAKRHPHRAVADAVSTEPAASAAVGASIASSNPTSAPEPQPALGAVGRKTPGGVSRSRRVRIVAPDP